jgi:hypothetical protein
MADKACCDLCIIAYYIHLSFDPPATINLKS